MFHFINSLNLPAYIGLLLLAISLGIFALIKYRKEQASWKIVLCIALVEIIVLIVNRIIKEYQPSSSLYQISLIISLICGIIFFISIFVGAYITQNKS